MTLLRQMIVTSAALGMMGSLSVQAKETSLEKQVRVLLDRLPAALEPLMKVSGDSMDPRITVSSQGVTAVKQTILFSSSTVENSFLRAFIDRKTGSVTAQIYHIASYGGTGWNFFETATVETGDGLKEVRLDRIGTDVDCSRYGCWHTEDVGVPIGFEALEAAAAKFNPSEPARGIHYRLFAQSGQKIDEAVPGNEIVAFVNVVNRLRPHNAAPQPDAEMGPTGPFAKAESRPAAAGPAAMPKAAPKPRSAVRCVTCR